MSSLQTPGFELMWYFQFSDLITSHVHRCGSDRYCDGKTMLLHNIGEKQLNQFFPKVPAMCLKRSTARMSSVNLVYNSHAIRQFKIFSRMVGA